MAALLLFLKTPLARYLGIALAVLALLVGVYVKGRHDDAAGWWVKLDAARDDLRTANDDITALKASITAQNAAVATLKAEGDAKTAAADKALQQAHVATETATKVAARVQAYKSPSGEPDTAVALDILKGRADQ